MKSLLRFLLATVAVPSSLVLSSSAAQAQTTNLIANPSFEEPGTNGNDNPSNPTDWQLITNSFGAWDGTTELPNGGNFVLHPGASFGNGGRYQDVTTVVGQEYEFSFWATGFVNGKATQNGLVEVGTPGPVATDLSQNNNHEYVYEGWSVPLHQSADDWRQFIFTFTAETATTRISFQNLAQGPGENAINIDLVELIPISTAELLSSSEEPIPKLYSPNGNFYLMLQNDGNLVVRRSDGLFIWGLPGTDVSSNQFGFNAGGDFCVGNDLRDAWCAGTTGTDNVLTLGDDAYLRIVDGQGLERWRSTHENDPFLQL